MGNGIKKPRNVRVIKNELEPETPEVLAASIIAISTAFQKLLDQGLTERAIVVLIKGMSGMQEVPTSHIAIVIQNLPKLGSYYIRKPIK